MTLDSFTEKIHPMKIGQIHKDKQEANKIIKSYPIYI